VCVGGAVQCVCVHVGRRVVFTVACGWGLYVCFHVHVVHRVVSVGGYVHNIIH